MHKFIEYPAT